MTNQCLCGKPREDGAWSYQIKAEATVETPESHRHEVRGTFTEESHKQQIELAQETGQVSATSKTV